MSDNKSKIDFEGQKVDRDFLIEHYKRTESFWRHWTPTIWSVPSIAFLINIGTYSVIFDENKNFELGSFLLIIGILILLNVTLTIGVYMHMVQQKAFGQRLVKIEKELMNINSVPLPKGSASKFYVLAMVIMAFLSVLLLTLRISGVLPG